MLAKQFQVLCEAHQVAQSLHVPTVSVEAAVPEHTVIVGGSCDKVKGLEQTIIKDGTVGLGFRDIVVNLSERAQSSMSTPMVSNSTSWDVLEDSLNFTRERDVVRRCTNRSERLKLNSTWINPGSNYKFPCPLQSHDHELLSAQSSLLLTQRIPGQKLPGGTSVLRA